MSSPMRAIVKKRIFWAGKGFTHRGVWVWMFRKNIRIIPTNKPFSWFGRRS